MKLENNKIKQILESWSLEPIEIKKTKKGEVNHNWIIKTKKGKFVLRKLAEDYNEKQLNFELDHLIRLKKEKFSYEIPLPVITLSGKNYIKTKEGLFWLYLFIEGNHKNSLSSKELTNAAKMISQHHRIIKKLNSKNGQKIPRDFEINILKKDFKKYREKVRDTKAYQIFKKESLQMERLLKSLDCKNYNKLKKYPLHRDLNPDNIIWKDEKIKGIIDFDNIGRTNEAFINDLVTFAQYFCSSNNKLNIKRIRSLIREYSKENPLKPEEIKLIPDFLIYNYICDFGYAYWMLVNDPKRAKIGRLNKYARAANWYYGNKNKIISQLEKIK